MASRDCMPEIKSKKFTKTSFHQVLCTCPSPQLCSHMNSVFPFWNFNGGAIGTKVSNIGGSHTVGNLTAGKSCVDFIQRTMGTRSLEVLRKESKWCFRMIYTLVVCRLHGKDKERKEEVWFGFYFSNQTRGNQGLIWEEKDEGPEGSPDLVIKHNHISDWLRKLEEFKNKSMKEGNRKLMRKR